MAGDGMWGESDYELAEREYIRNGHLYEVVAAPRGFPLFFSRSGPSALGLFEAIAWFAFLIVMVLLERVLPVKVGILRQKAPTMSWPRVIYKEVHPRGADTEPRMDELLENVKNGDFDHLLTDKNKT